MAPFRTFACAFALLAGALPANAAAPAKATVAYACAEDQQVSVVYDGEQKVLVTYDGTTYKMKRAKSADGMRFVGSGMQWWSKGDGGFLAGHSTSHLIARDCKAKK